MKLVFFILFILMFLFLGIRFSKISINICKFNLNNKFEKINANYKIRIILFLYGIIPIISVVLTERNIIIFGLKISNDRIKNNSKFKLFMSDVFNKAKKDFKISKIKYLKPDLDNINLKLNLGTESFLMTNFLVFLISTGLSLGIKNMIRNFDSDKYKYIIKPDFEEKNKIFLELKGLLKIKTTNLIECAFGKE